VRLSEAEITRLANFQAMAEHDFIQQFTRLTSDRRGLALMDKPNGECIFLEAGRCAVQPVKPQQCRDFPNLWNFPGAEASCRALKRDVDKADYVRLVSAATLRTPEAVADILRRQKRKSCQQLKFAAS
jgi:Fe-S-cluster containining protein